MQNQPRDNRRLAMLDEEMEERSPYHDDIVHPLRVATHFDGQCIDFNACSIYALYIEGALKNKTQLGRGQDPPRWEREWVLLLSSQPAFQLPAFDFLVDQSIEPGIVPSGMGALGELERGGCFGAARPTLYRTKKAGLKLDGVAPTCSVTQGLTMPPDPFPTWFSRVVVIVVDLIYLGRYVV